MKLDSSPLPWLFVVAVALITASIPAWANSGRSKAIDFEDELVEGMNKRPLDSVSQLGSKDRRHKKPHLYRKRSGFRDENREALQTAGYVR